MADNPDKPFDDEESPTQPDILKFRCPNCSNGKETLGYIEEEEWTHGSLHKTIRRTCEICWGAKWIDRQALNRWAMRQSKI